MTDVGSNQIGPITLFKEVRMKKSLSREVLLIVTICLLLIGQTVTAASLRILTTEEPPTNYTYAGKFTGTTVDIVEEIKTRIGETADIEVMPWSSAFNIAKRKPNIAIFTCGKTEERVEHGFHFVGPVFTRSHTLFKRKGDPITIESVEDIKKQNLKLGAMMEDWRGFYFRKRGILVDFSNSHFVSAKKLLANRFSLWVISDLEAPIVMNLLSEPMDQIEPAFVFNEGDSYIMLSKETPQSVVDQWKKAFQAMQQTDFFTKTAEKWSDILMIDLGYAPEKGFFIKK